ncbi:MULTISPECIES: GTP cyclohydrolase FolE2 [unclassified Bacillus (in: firmicutes)]|uniref:GTP cyclohydrolase FolE2 n=1 Tax=unclassified Bacillus (in: firmicutes) TaxID=185979 RepID=UPI000D030066|nr:MULTISPECIES: GTP cyclohydrolase FolE2 [unclassified Bacillus (in: firmicutes)]PRR88507.1 GTP cyclohydrolase I FolE2 [Bacillus sp. NMCN1]PRR96285.1 GTP cyclohydrolase I FolE2 [Bacillus sp. NMCN6]
MFSFPPKKERHQQFGSVPPSLGTKPSQKENMTDIQKTEQDFYFPLEQVGICRLSYPVRILSKTAPQDQITSADFALSTSLRAHEKGIHMSRLTEQLYSFYESGKPLDVNSLKELTAALARQMNQSSASIQVSFPWYMEKQSPVTGKSGLMHATITYDIHFHEKDGWTCHVGCDAKVTTLCPCSKEISEYGAHNQRGSVSIQVELFEQASLPNDMKAALLHIIESNASAPLYPVLKRPDEKKVTEEAYENPRFVEDVTRLMAIELYEQPWIRGFQVECRNEESIHQHDAYAKCSYQKNL